LLLEVEDIWVRYGAIAAVQNVRLTVGAGEIVCVVGPNGAGKSSTLLAVTGVVRPSSGKISIAGIDISGHSVEQIARLGVSLVPEGRHVFAGLTVAENLGLGAPLRRATAPPLYQDLDKLFALFPILKDRYRQPAGKLSGGEQQQLVIARALVTQPKLLLVDEPSLGLAPLVIDRVFATLRALRAEGITMVVVEQNLRRAAEIADRIYVLRSGRIAFEAASRDDRDMQGLESAYFGHHGIGAV
jgi:branched-chain amino acid transport system ATP-binding protein